MKYSLSEMTVMSTIIIEKADLKADHTLHTAEGLNI